MFETVRPEQRYKPSRHTIWACDYHIIWCTKYRKQVLTSVVQERLKEIIMEKQADYNYQVTALEIMPEHVHLLASIHPKYSVTEIVGKIKGYSSLILRREFYGLKRIRALSSSSFSKLQSLLCMDCHAQLIGDSENAKGVVHETGLGM